MSKDDRNRTSDHERYRNGWDKVFDEMSGPMMEGNPDFERCPKCGTSSWVGCACDRTAEGRT